MKIYFHRRWKRQIEMQFEGAKTGSQAPAFRTLGVQFIVRYPLDIRAAAEIDDHLSRAAVDLVNGDSDLKNAIAGAPKIRATMKG